jgi:hypothetical protein
LRLGLGDSVDYRGDADLVFSDLYGPLPTQLIGKPAIINVFGNKKARAEEWCGTSLTEVSKWGRGLTNTVYSNVHCWSVDLSDLEEDEPSPGHGWFPEDLVRRMLVSSAFNALPRGSDPVVVFDGFMGRGTVGKVCANVGLQFVGIDRDPERVAFAREYLGC